MAYNGDAPYSKRMRTDDDPVLPKNVRHHHFPVERPYRSNSQSGSYGGYSDYDGQPRRSSSEYGSRKRIKTEEFCEEYIPKMDHRKGEPEAPNHVILFTIINPAYPITVDVMYTICQTYGNVLRLVIFKKNGVQAMVEFDNVEAATRAKDGLQGADIYSGCCTLRIEYAKPTKLNVFKNDTESWDFTNPNMGHMDKPTSSRPPLLKDPRFGMPATPYAGNGGGMNGVGGARNSSSLYNNPMPERYNSIGNNLSNGLRGASGLAGAAPGASFLGAGGAPSNGPMASLGQPNPALPHQGAVLMVYGLCPKKTNPDRLFNLLCLYGNVVRVKFLKTKEGCAMVQMGDSSAVDRCIENLNNVTFFGTKMQLGYSKQAFLADVQQPYELPDGTPSFKDYMGNKNNRFINPEMASKNRIQPPSKILHFFNTPPGLTDEQMECVFKELQVAPHKTMKLFASKTDRSSSGLLEFNNISEALEALVCGNHSAIPNPNSKFPFVMKLCFSSSRHIPSMKQD